MTSRSSVDRVGRYVLIVGNIGSGKTSLAGVLARTLGLKHYSEPFEENVFLDAFYDQPEKYAFRSQLWFLLAHQRQHLELASGDDWAIKDGSVFDSAGIVTRRMSEQGLLTADEWRLYQEVYQALQPSCTLPALTIWLQARPEALLARIQKRARSFESGITLDFLRALEIGYGEWTAQWSPAPLIAIDTTSFDLEEVTRQALPAMAKVLRA